MQGVGFKRKRIRRRVKRVIDPNGREWPERGVLCQGIDFDGLLGVGLVVDDPPPFRVRLRRCAPMHKMDVFSELRHNFYPINRAIFL